MKSFQVVILSVAIHLGIYWIFLNLAGTPHPTPADAETLELEVVSRPTARPAPKLILPDQEELKNINQPADFMSDRRRRVSTETIAPKPLQRAVSQKEQTQRQRDIQLFPQAIPTVSGSFKPGLPPTPLLRADSISQLLPPDIRLGGVTALNTDSHMYYSFFERVNEQITFPWVDMVSMAARRYLSPARAYQREWITQIEVILDRDGKYEDAYLIKKSGLRAFDQAALEAFRQGRMYPHPPPGLIDQDTNKIHLQYSFHVLWDAQAYSQR